MMRRRRGQEEGWRSTRGGADEVEERERIVEGQYRVVFVFYVWVASRLGRQGVMGGWGVETGGERTGLVVQSVGKSSGGGGV